MSADIQLIHPDWQAPPRVRAAFTLRTGGVSPPPYDSLNLGAGIGDSADAVAENRRRLRELLCFPSEPAWLEQVHGIEVMDLDVYRDEDFAARVGSGGDVAVQAVSRADASVTRCVGRVCAIRVADCMPVLFAARDGSAVGAAHAGWRGLAGGVLEATIQQLGVLPSKLVAWMGPTIGPRNFEVGDDVRTAFLADDPAANAAFTPNSRGRWQCDLYTLARRRLAAAGVTDVSGGAWCTHADASRFFSYRRDGQCGRMAALIWIE